MHNTKTSLSKHNLNVTQSSIGHLTTKNNTGFNLLKKNCFTYIVSDNTKKQHFMKHLIVTLFILTLTLFYSLQTKA